MGKLLCGSMVWRFLCKLAAWFSAIAGSSSLLQTLSRSWRSSRTSAWLQRRLSADDTAVKSSRLHRCVGRLNAALARRMRLRTAWNASFAAKIYAALLRPLRGSVLLGRIFAGGLTSVLILILGVYVPLDYALRDVLSVPLLSSVWDELLLLVCFFWIIWTRTGRAAPLSARTNPLDVPILLFIGIGFVLMLLVAPYPDIQLSGYRATVQYLLWFFVITRLLRDDGDWMLLYRLMVAAAVVIALHGIYQYIIKVPMPAHWMSKAETAVRTRVFSIFGSPNIMGDYMVIFAPMTAALAYSTDRKPLKVLSWLCTFVICIACLFTMSRGAWIGMALSIVLFILLVDRRLFWLLLAGGVVLIFIPFVRSRIGFLFTDEFVAASNNNGRSERWTTGLQLLQSSNPLLGFGLGMFGGAVAMQRKIMDWIRYFYMDNYYLKILVEMGYVGLAAFLVMIVSWLCTGCRALYRLHHNVSARKRYPLCAGMFSGLAGVLAHCFFENIFEEPYMMVLFWTIAAMVVWYGFIYKSAAPDEIHAHPTEN